MNPAIKRSYTGNLPAPGLLAVLFSALIPLASWCQAQSPTSVSPAQSWEVISNHWRTADLAEVRRTAEQGEATAQYFLARAYIAGDLLQKDHAQGVKWTRAAADQGLAAAQGTLGALYESGLGLPRDRKQAEFWYLKAEAQNLAFAQYRLGFLAKYQGTVGNTVVGNKQVAAEWFEKAAAQGHAGAMFELGNLYFFGDIPRSHVEAAKWFTRAAEKGYPGAAARLGDLYSRNRFDMPADPEKAARWYRIAVTNHDAGAEFVLALFLLENPKLAESPSESKHLLEKAVAQGNPQAAVKLASLESSSEAALHQLSRDHLELGSGQGDGEGRLALGLACEEGRDGPVDLQRACEVYWQIIRAGPEKDADDARRRLLRLYTHEKLQPDPKSFQAPKTLHDLGDWLKTWRERTASSDIHFQVGELLLRGDLIPKDPQAATDFYETSARAGNPEAMNRLGELWAQGLDGEPDRLEAARWFRRAAALGLPAAQANLNRSN